MVNRYYIARSQLHYKSISPENTIPGIKDPASTIAPCITMVPIVSRREAFVEILPFEPGDSLERAVETVAKDILKMNEAKIDYTVGNANELKKRYSQEMVVRLDREKRLIFTFSIYEPAGYPHTLTSMINEEIVRRIGEER